jgi:glycosyltransferase involved in cell wall biosynthesis
MTKQVLHILGTAQLEGSGIARIVGALAAGLDPLKYQVHAWFLGEDGPLVGELQAAGAVARWIKWGRGAREPIGAYRFWRNLLNQDFAIVHQHYGARSIRQLVRAASDARIVVHLHGRITDSTTDLRVPVPVRGADAVIAVSHFVALQVPVSRPQVVYSGVVSARELHQANRVSANTVVIGAACRLVPLKGLTTLIRAIASLSSEYPRLRLEIAGSGPQREELEREIHELRLDDQIRLLGWEQDLGHLFRKWDIFAMPSLDEGLPIATLEAMAEGLPVVATTVGGLPELVEDGHTGLLVPPLDPEAFSKALRRLIADPKLRQSMGSAGRNRAIKKFSVRSMVAKIESIYDSLTPV